MKMLANITESDCRVPSQEDKVYKDECIVSFDSPASEAGIFISLKTFVGVGKKFVEFYHKRTDSAVFLNYRMIKKKKAVKEDEAQQAQKRTRLALGVEGGFALDEAQYTLEERYNLLLMPSWDVIPLPAADLPAFIQRSVDGVMAADSVRKREELEVASWDGSFRPESQEAQCLVQLDNGVRVGPTGWKCALCDLKENLWLNLTDGKILCGRKFWDGSGGNNHALEHFKETGYPLAVKLGTITPEGADVFSYTEGDMVVDLSLSDHLAHFGIDVMKMQKTDKSMMELEIDLNEKFGSEWRLIQEEGAGPLTPLYGPGYTGIHNLGNSCYMNSCLQVLFSIPEFTARYNLSDSDFFTVLGRHGLACVPSDFGIQMMKMGRGLCSGEYSVTPAGVASSDDGDRDGASEGEVVPQNGIFPYLFKSVIGRDHREFATKKQQDAQEFLLHLFELMARQQQKENAAVGAGQPKRDNAAHELFAFSVEDRLQCLASQRVSYHFREEYMVQVPVPMERTLNADEVAAYQAQLEARRAAEGREPTDMEVVRPRVQLTDCVATYFDTVFVDDFYSSAVKDRTRASKGLRMMSYPKCLILQARRFLLGQDWVPKKLDVALEVPDVLDLSEYKSAGGLQPGEELLLQEPVSGGGEAASGPPPAPAVDEAVLAQLTEMGFSEAACRKAIVRTNNSGLEAAMSWVMEHMGDADFNEPLPSATGGLQKTSSGSSSQGSQTVSPEAVEMLVAMGFTERQARKSLRSTEGNMERAVDWLFSHPDDNGEDEPQTPAEDETPQPWQGSTRYELFAFISHMGTSAQSGHYVCHVKRDGRWVIYNDEKVAASERPPRELAYLYFYRRLD